MIKISKACSCRLVLDARVDLGPLALTTSLQPVMGSNSLSCIVASTSSKIPPLLSHLNYLNERKKKYLKKLTEALAEPLPDMYILL